MRQNSSKRVACVVGVGGSKGLFWVSHLHAPLLKQRHCLLELLEAQFTVAVNVDSLEHHPLLEELSQKDQEVAELCNLDLIVALFAAHLSLLD